MPEIEEMLTTADLMKLARVARFKIENDRKLGLLKAVRIGKKSIRFRRKDAEEWMGTPATTPDRKSLGAGDRD